MFNSILGGAYGLARLRVLNGATQKRGAVCSFG
jgi:hypothetical protein